MGASFHAASIGAFMLLDAGVHARATEATDLLYSGPEGLHPFDTVFYLSQSGGSGEIRPFLAGLADAPRLIAVTNDENSPLARGAGRVLPLYAGEERWIASKTYINALAVLWLIARRWAGRPPSEALDELSRLSAEVARLQAESGAALEFLEETFSTCERVIFLGGGPHALTAREAAMTLSEWPKLSSRWYGLGAFRHGFIETVDPGTAVFIFAPPGPTQTSAVSLARELAGYGARVSLIDRGVLGETVESNPRPGCPHELLSPVLDILPIQLYAEAAARKRFPQPGFRYLSKVVVSL
jgi:glucosamine--fructose-6-phosphate aminotransferase (isomerizing)